MIEISANRNEEEQEQETSIKEFTEVHKERAAHVSETCYCSVNDTV